MSFNFGDRLVMLEQRVGVLQKDLATNLNRFAESFGKKIQVDRTFQLYVDTVLTEIKQDMEALFKHVGIQQPSKDGKIAPVSEEDLATALATGDNGDGESNTESKGIITKD